MQTWDLIYLYVMMRRKKKGFWELRHGLKMHFFLGIFAIVFIRDLSTEELTRKWYNTFAKHLIPFSMIFLNENFFHSLHEIIYFFACTRQNRLTYISNLFTHRFHILIKRPLSISDTFSSLHFIAELTIFCILGWFRSVVVTNTCPFLKTFQGTFNFGMNRITGHNISWLQRVTFFVIKI